MLQVTAFKAGNPHEDVGTALVPGKGTLRDFCWETVLMFLALSAGHYGYSCFHLFNVVGL